MSWIELINHLGYVERGARHLHFALAERAM